MMLSHELTSLRSPHISGRLGGGKFAAEDKIGTVQFYRDSFSVAELPALDSVDAVM